MDGSLKGKKRLAAASAVFAAAFLMLYFNDILTLSVKESVSFCLGSIIPSVFPFLFITDVITRYELYPKKSDLLSGIFIGTVCGFPSGAKFAVSLYQSGKVSKKRAEYINAVSNNAGISFTYGFAANALKTDGAVLLAIQLISVLISAAVLRSIYGKDDGDYVTYRMGKEINGQKTSLISSVKSAVSTTSMICAFIIVFSALSDMICFHLLPFPYIKTAVKGFFEFSIGIKEASALSHGGLITGVMILCWSGLCVMFQIKSVIKDHFSAVPYIAAHLIQSAAAGTLALIYLSL